MSDDLTARDVIARAIASTCDDPVGRAFELDDPSIYGEESDAVLTALAAAGYTIVTTDSVLDAQYDAKMTAFDGTEEPF